MGHVPTYTQAFKDAAVNKVLAGQSKQSVCREFGIDKTTINKWVDRASQSVSSNPTFVTLAIPDLHCPFQHPDSLAFLKAVKEKYKPTAFICLGDEVDFHALSRWDHDPDGLSPGKELSAAIEALIPFYLEFPEMMVCESNHTIRGHKKAFNSGIPAAFLAQLSSVLNAPDGWAWRSHWIVDGVRYFHGDAGRSGQNAHTQYLRMFKQNLVIGHIHSFAGVATEGKFFAVNSGCLIDESAYAFKYGKHFPIRPSLGCTVVHAGKTAHFVPMLLDANDRWTGEVF